MEQGADMSARSSTTRRSTTRNLVCGGAAGALLLFYGFVVFACWSTRNVPIDLQRADGIVVLTGAERRIDEGLRLLREGLGDRLLISGINPKTSPEDVIRLARPASSSVPWSTPCCIDFGYMAQSTVGNADETRTWAMRHRFTRLIVVTSSYHMPRSLSELAQALPNVELVAYPVVPRAWQERPWWLRLSTTRRLAGEYVKLLPSIARYAASRMLRPLEAFAASGLAGSNGLGSGG